LTDVRNEDVPIIDRVAGYNNQRFFNALDSDIKTLGNFRIRLLNENSNDQSVNVTNLFNLYGY